MSVTSASQGFTKQVFPPSTPKATVSGTTGSPTVDTSSRSGKTIYKFTGSGTITIDTAGSVEMLVVGAGGSGAGGYNTGQAYGLGGGAGGAALYKPTQFLESGTYTILVGAGGTPGGPVSSNGGPGQESMVYGNSIPLIIAPGGDMGSTSTYGSSTISTGMLLAGSGGAGAPGGTGPAGTPKYSGIGYQGGASNGQAGGGGGGAGSAGSAATSSYIAGNGGNGVAYSITGTSTYYGGGGGGGTGGSSSAGSGGSGGGGAGRPNTNGAATSGTANTGGGGGGNNAIWGQVGGNGGSGVVIVVVG